MSELPSNRKKPTLPGGQPDRFQPKVLLIWAVIFLVLLALWSISYQHSDTTVDEFTISQLMKQFEAGTITDMQIKKDPTSSDTDWYEVTGTYSETDKDGKIVPTKFVATGHITDQLHTELIMSAKNGLNPKEVTGNGLFIGLLITILPWLIFVIFLYWILMKQFKIAGRGAMAFGKSRARMLTRDRERMTFGDVAGCDEAKEEVQEVVEFLKDPKKFQRIGGRIPKGVLMVGPPGTGKTLLARAVAGEADVPFFSISGSDFVEMFVGVGAARVRDMFEQGRKNAPCIIFIDEIDAVGRQRGAGWGGGNDEREQTLNSLLVEMDGFDGHEGVIIIAATNRPDVLDNALLRPGRFDRQIIIDLPDLNGRAEVLRVHAKKIKLSKDVDLTLVARKTPGFSGADLANLLNESALIAARYNKSEVQMPDIDEAREKISYGRERRKLMDAEDKKIVAYHEAGHAIVQAVIDDGKLPLHKITIIPRGQSLGSTMFAPTKDILNHGYKQLLTRLCTLMGGRVAEDLEFGNVTSGAAGDIKMATKLARQMVCDWGMSSLGPIAYGDNQDQIFLAKEISRNHGYSEETARQIDAEIHRLVEEQYQRAKDILTKNREVLDKVAKALLEFETIDGKHVHEILETGAIVSPITPIQTKNPTVPPVSPTAPEKTRKGEEIGPGPQAAGMPA
ncbi:MAG TPA: ATP-dependent zinc metalloprotease FtsH [Opitutales bacterium]|jgi:cell division protease FtsH|nr:ATP-dependent zinc metalloprotease FtsH [Opitutales bacterium]